MSTPPFGVQLHYQFSSQDPSLTAGIMPPPQEESGTSPGSLLLCASSITAPDKLLKLPVTFLPPCSVPQGGKCCPLTAGSQGRMQLEYSVGLQTWFGAF